jgi:S-formylglutathione hydrolase FrmB
MRAARRRRRGAQLLVVALVALAAALIVRSVVSMDTHGASVRHFELRSALVHRTLRETLVVPAGVRAGEGRPLLVFLHGRGRDGEDSNLNPAFFSALRSLGRRAPVVVFANGGESSYWHDRAGGRWGSYVLREVIPEAVRRGHADPRRIAIGGISMGGFGALDLARLHPGRFCAAGAHSPALWVSGGQSAAGAFDDAADFARHDVVRAAGSDPRAFAAQPLWIDAGRSDPFDPGDQAFIAGLRRGGAAASVHRWDGGHDGAYWRAHYAAYLRFYAAALARC